MAMPLIIFILQIIIYFGHFFAVNAVDPIHSCAGIPITEMKKELKYHSFLGLPPQLKIFMKKKHDFAGNFGKVHVGYMQWWSDIRCLALKIYGSKTHIDYLNARDVMNAIRKAEKDPKKRNRLMIMIDAGELDDSNGSVIIMDLGVETCSDRIYSKPRLNYVIEEELINNVKKLLEPLKELHRFAIHFDLKPDNFVLVPEGPALVLKLFDFDGSTLIPGEGTKRATLEFAPATKIVTSEYVPPEFYNPNRMVSTKFDIWSLGISIYEVILVQPDFEGSKVKEKEQMWPILLQISNIYSNIKRDKQFKIIPKLLFDDPDATWIRDNLKVLNHILDVWIKYPKVAILLTNMLSSAARRNHRMSAIGCLDLLAGNCLPAEVQPVLKAGELRIFDEMTIDAFQALLRQKWKNRNDSALFGMLLTEEPYSAMIRKVERIKLFMDTKLALWRNPGNTVSRWVRWVTRVGRYALATCDTETTG